MCGIFGIIGRNARVPAEVLERATRSLAHRGPDDSGTVILRASTPEPIEIGLGNRRLAILDLSPQGHQPMNDPATGNWIVYNGEVYNFREVRAKLRAAGRVFRQSFRYGSDPQSICVLGRRSASMNFVGCLRSQSGMRQRQRLFVARDPMGIKPLYFFRSDQYFIFSSEVRTLLGTGLVPAAH